MHLIAVVIPTWVYAILWRSSFVYTSALIRKSCNHNSHRTQNYQSHSAQPYKLRKTPTSEHSGVISLRTLILAPPRGDDIYISFSYYFCLLFFQSPLEFTTERKQASLGSYTLPINRSVAMRPPTARRLARAVVGCIASLSDIPSGIDWYIRVKPLLSSCSECSMLPPTAIHRT